MTFKVLLHPKVAKALQKLDTPDKVRIKAALGELAVDPLKLGNICILQTFGV